MEKQTKTESKPNVAVTGTCSNWRYGATILSHPLTGRNAAMMKTPPMIVSGTTETIPARMAERYRFSLTLVSAGTSRLLRKVVAAVTVLDARTFGAILWTTAPTAAPGFHEPWQRPGRCRPCPIVTRETCFAPATGLRGKRGRYWDKRGGRKSLHSR